jgi:hypothetical protein
MFLKNKKVKAFFISFFGLCVFICVFILIRGSNNIENIDDKNKEYEVNDFENLPDDLSEALCVLLESRSYPRGFTHIIEYLASKEYIDQLKKVGPKTNGVFVRLGDWVFEFQTGNVTGFCARGDDSVNIIGSIDFDKRPMVIKLKVENATHVRRK